ncbi:MAG TPA: type II toxin-antitoxin system PemK/MazF family toxin [Gemmatimonadales bacterium]|nr:type II toxin-antitoxin system PemK/MazF family toxin [Gemmatimonadales bacterium]
MRGTRKLRHLTGNWRKRRCRQYARPSLLISRGEIFWVNFGATRGREQAGQRPAVVIQNDAGNASSETTIVALITSRRFSRPYPFHVEIGPADSGLQDPSTILLEQMQTVSIQRLRRRIGLLSADVMVEVDRAIHHSLGLDTCLFNGY